MSEFGKIQPTEESIIPVEKQVMTGEELITHFQNEAKERDESVCLELIL